MNNALLNSFDLGYFDENEDENLLIGFIGKCCEEGKPIPGYWGKTHIERYYKAQKADGTIGSDRLQFICNIDTIDGQNNLASFDVHSTGSSVWKSKILLRCEDEPERFKAERQIVVNEINGIECLNVINVMNADVLPSYLPEEEIELQTNAIALDVDYYENCEEYENNKIGDIGIASGQMFATQFLYNHQTAPDGKKLEREVDYSTNDYVLLRGTVRGAYVYTIMFDEENIMTRYLMVQVETKYGIIDLVHSIDQIKEDQRRKLKEGAEVFAICVLQGDAYINDYENGRVLDYKNNLRALRYAMVKGNEERIKSILSSEVTFVSKTTNKIISGIDNVIDFLKQKRDDRSQELITRLDKTKINNDELECIRIPIENENDQLITLELNSENKISKIFAFDEE